MSGRKLIIAFLLLLPSLPLMAQDTSTTVTVTEITYDAVEQETITDSAFYDWWRVQASAGDIMVVDMGGSDGLAPLIGILDPSQNLVATSEDGQPNQSVTVEYTVPADGQYTIVATRVGNQAGTTTGRYALRLRRANTPDTANTDQYVDVTFPCKDFEATTAVALRFAEDASPDLKYRITVYGEDGFEPVIRLHFDVPGEKPFDLCNTNADATLTDTYTRPGEATHTITQDNLNTVSQLIFTGANNAGLIDVTIASKNGASGRYFAVIEGFSIQTADDTDQIDIRMGPLAKLTPLTVYMVAMPNSRLDPYMAWLSANLVCDDAGRAECKTVSSFVQAGVSLHEGQPLTITGDRSDAGLTLAPGTTDIVSLQLSSRANDTFGTYALFFMGELPESS